MKKLMVAGLCTLTALSQFSAAQAMPAIFFKSVEPAAKSQVIRVQAAPAGAQQMDEVVRDLNGRIEELNFQLLQMQEQIRKMQEDNEFRFQQLEKGTGKSGALEKPADDNSSATASADKTDELQETDEIGQIAEQANADTAIDDQTSEVGGLETIKPGTLGNLIFNSDGDLVGSDVNPADNSAASIPDTADESADEEYKQAYSHILAGDYALAETAFVQYLDAYPEGNKSPDASFWLGEAQYSQGKYTNAAETFLNAYKAYGEAPKAPEMLLKLSMSLAALDNRETACATLAEIPRRYPKASKTVISKVASEQSRLSC